MTFGLRPGNPEEEFLQNNEVLNKKIKHVNMKHDDQESMDSGVSHSGQDFADKDEGAMANGTEKSNKVAYNEHDFLVDALGEEMANMENSVNTSSSTKDHYYSSVPEESNRRLTYNMEKSVGNSNISTLLWSIGTEHHSEAIYSLYSTVKKTPKSKHQDNGKKVSKSVSIVNDIDYASIDEYQIKSKEEIMGKIVVQWETIQKVSKALREFKTRPNLFGKSIQIEAEKPLLISSIKRDILKDELKKITTESNAQTSVSFKIKNICFLKPKTVLKKNNWHFMCIVQSGECIRANSIMQEDKGEIICKESFDFEGAPADLEINMSLCFTFKKYQAQTTCLTLTRTSRDQSNIIGQSSFKLLRQTSIKSPHPVQYIFKFVKIPKDSPIFDSFIHCRH